MNTSICRLITPILIALPAITLAQQVSEDTVISRLVTVERDYQPTIHSAARITQSPEAIKTTIPLTPVNWSFYSDSVAVPPTNCHLDAASISPAPSNSKSDTLAGGLGHQNTDFIFHYRVSDNRKLNLDIAAHHNACWGTRTMADSRLSLDGRININAAELTFHLSGENEFFNRYGRYYDGQNGLIPMDKNDASYWQHRWTGNAHLGIQSRSSNPFSYRVQVGYTAFHAPYLATEHQVRSHLDLSYHGDNHSGGIHVFAQNHFYTLGRDARIDNIDYSHHAIHVEPFYAYSAKRLSVHAGVNIDMHVGKGQLLTSNPNFAFAPSPNISVDWTMDNDILNLYATAKGSYNMSSMQEFYTYCRYFTLSADCMPALQDRHTDAYTPLDATIGIRLRPLATMLLTIHGGYAILKNQYFILAPLSPQSSQPLDLTNRFAHLQRFTIGADIHYHWRDIVILNISGNYYGYRLDSLETNYTLPSRGRVYDRPSWDLNVRLDWNIDSKWTVFTDNHFAGAAWALIVDPTTPASPLIEKQLKTTININVGASYAFNRWLSLSLKVNNCLNRHNDIYYGYQTQGIHFLLGALWKF